MTTITSLQNARVKDFVRLRDAKHRRREGRFPLDGVREIERAISKGVKIRECYVCETLCKTEESRSLSAKVETLAEAEVFAVTEAIFEKMAFGDRAEGVLATAETPVRRLADFAPSKNAVICVLECVEKPGNVGAVLRSADAAGVSALILADSKCDLFNPNAVRASMGAIFSLPAFEATSAETLDWLRRNKIAVFAARVDGSEPYDEKDYRGATAFILGSEADGLTDAWRGDDVSAIRLPMQGIVDSLNVSVTAATLFYEALRQRKR